MITVIKVLSDKKNDGLGFSWLLEYPYGEIFEYVFNFLKQSTRNLEKWLFIVLSILIQSLNLSSILSLFLALLSDLRFVNKVQRYLHSNNELLTNSEETESMVWGFLSLCHSLAGWEIVLSVY